MFQAVIFDVDGTIVDTRFVVDAIAEAIWQLRGYRLTHEDTEFIYGATHQTTLNYLKITEEEMPRFVELFHHYMAEYMPRQRLFPHIWETMSALKSQGLLLGINTSRTKDEVDFVVKTTGMNFPALCNQCITCDMVPAPKPDPCSILLFSKLTGVPVENILFVGDSVFDCGCASNAGCSFALATWGTSQEINADFYPSSPEDVVQIVCAANAKQV